MMLALPLTAAVLLQAKPTQMGLLMAIELLPFVILSPPAGVWRDRVRKRPHHRRRPHGGRDRSADRADAGGGA